MKEYININEPDEGDTLVMEDSNDSPSLMLVLSGTVELSQINPETNEPSRIHKVWFKKSWKGSITQVLSNP